MHTGTTLHTPKKQFLQIYAGKGISNSNIAANLNSNAQIF